MLTVNWAGNDCRQTGRRFIGACWNCLPETTVCDFERWWRIEPGLITSCGNAGDPELGFTSCIISLVHWLEPGNTYSIYLDWQQNQEQHRFRDLHAVLTNKLRADPPSIAWNR